MIRGYIKAASLQKIGLMTLDMPMYIDVHEVVEAIIAT